tara:strand:+ start:485 stop:1615 length:1131 start_codon:yes stop_codon:yes gene_type:complete
MKLNLKTILILVVLLSFSFATSQNDYGKSDDDARIVLNTFIPDNILENTPSARKLFITKLSQIASRNGLGGSESNTNNRFIISGDLNILTKDVLPTAPPKYAVTIETSLAVGDGIDGKSFASEYIEFKGVGVSEDKAFIAAIRKINPRHKMVKELLENGKQKIIEYYNTQCDFISKEATTLSDSRNFDEAVYVLSQVPKVTKACYDSSMDLAVEITKKKFEFECQTKISEARALISNGDYSGASALLGFYTQDMDCYSDVAALLKEINTGLCSKFLGEAQGHWANRDSRSAAQALANINASSPCYEESLTISKEISGYLDEKEQREWDLNYEKYKDELAIKNRNLDNEAARINAVRDIGVAYGQNQPKNVTYRSIY